MKQYCNIIFCFLILASANGVAGDISRIGAPPRLQGVKHKILVLEYDSPQQSEWGRDISQIIAMNVLGTIEGVMSVGVINLQQTETRIELTPRRILQEAETQNALVVIWGEFYIDSTDVWLHSHLRLVPRKEFPASAFGLQLAETRSSDTLKAAVPTMQVNFAPIKIPVEAVKNISRLYRQTIILRDAPRANATTVGELKLGDTYYLLEKRNDWTKIQVRGGASGWARHTVLQSQASLGEVQGVVKMAQGIVQYMAGNYRQSAASIQTYLDNYAHRQDAMNRAFAHIMLGNCKFWGKEYFAHMPKDEDVSIEYFRAYQLLPDHPSPVNHLAILNLFKMRFAGQTSYRQQYEVFKMIEKNLINIIKTHNDLDAVNNLRIAYQTLSSDSRLFEMQKQTSGAALADMLNNKIIKLDEISRKINEQKR